MRRGIKKRTNKTAINNFKILGTNAAGIIGKRTSLLYNIEQIKPSVNLLNTLADSVLASYVSVC